MTLDKSEAWADLKSKLWPVSVYPSSQCGQGLQSRGWVWMMELSMPCVSKHIVSESDTSDSLMWSQLALDCHPCYDNS